MSYDVKCGRLAGDFLSDYRVQIEARHETPREQGYALAVLEHELAQRIQDVIEDFLNEKELQA